MTAENTDVDETEAPGFRMPHIYVILFVFTAIAALLTHVIPAGMYDRITLPNRTPLQKGVGAVGAFVATPALSLDVETASLSKITVGFKQIP